MATLIVEVVYALPAAADAVAVELPAGATLRDAVRASGLAHRHPEIDPERARLGVFGRVRRPDDPARDGDRVEVYRPLEIDPREARRRRALRISRRTSR